MFILINLSLIEDSWIDQDIKLLIRFPKCFVLTFLKIQKLILHINALFVLDNHYLIISIMSLILKTTQLLNIYLLVTVTLIMHLQPMKLHLFRILKRYKLLLKAILIIAQIMRHPEVYLQTVVVFIVAIFLLLSADITQVVLDVHMAFELVLVEVVLMAEAAIWMHEGYISELVDVSLLEMLVQSFESVEFLLFQYTGLLLNANFADVAIVVVFQMFFEEGN